jgi:hypothetical protein
MHWHLRQFDAKAKSVEHSPFLATGRPDFAQTLNLRAVDIDGGSKL